MIQNDCIAQNITYLTIQVAMCPDEAYFVILLCLIPDDFTHLGESAATQWVNWVIMGYLLMHPLLTLL
jgi:hypothetical protein